MNGNKPFMNSINKNMQNHNYIYIYTLSSSIIMSSHSTQKNFQTYTLTTLGGVDYIKYVQCRLLKLFFKIGQYQIVNIYVQFYFGKMFVYNILYVVYW
jgi:hypothetical protein